MGITIKASLLFFIFVFISTLALLNTASAGITITDAEATYEANLSSVSVPTEPISVKSIFNFNEEALLNQTLFRVRIPTLLVPIKEIFIINEDAAFDTSLCAVSIPTEPSPIKKIFAHLEEAKAYEDLIFPIKLMNDTTSPIITNVTVINITNNSATVKWDTDEIADSVVKYGKAPGIYTEIERNPLFVGNHTIALAKLSPGTKYYFVVNSTDRSGNSAESLECSFTTTGIFENYFPEENKAIETKNPKLAFSAYYHPINISVNLSVPPYPLPLNLSNITNIDKINAEFWLNERQKELLRTNGFVITDYGQEDDIVAPYEDMKERDIPIFVTTDTLLHLYHIQFNEILKGIEEREFFDDLVDMSNAMLLRSIQDYENFTDPELKEAARRNVAYFAVALKLLQTPTEGYNGSEDIKAVNFTVPDYVKEDVEKEIENISKHDGFHPSYIFNSDPNRDCEDECCYCEDYSQYIPRGHYTGSEKLKRYFKAMMWYGRIAFLLKGGNVSECSGIETPLITEEDAKIATIQAALISSELPTVEVENKTAQELWNRIYSVTAFFVGTADDLTPYEYEKAIGDVFGSEFDATELIDGEKILRLKAELAKLRSPEIYGGSGVCVVYPPITREKLHECLAKTRGLRFMGQRFVPDSYMFQQLVSPAVGMYVGNDTPFTMCLTDAGPARCFPRGLDIMAVLGSERAAEILIEEGDTEYAGINTSYDKQLEELKSQFAGFDITEWNRNLYWSWLYTLKPLLKQFGDGYPTFMQTKAWQEKELQTSLASWTELRHDTILYAKQSYTPPLKSMPPQQKPVVGYVEPVPEFYARLLALTEMTEKGLIDLDVLNTTEKARLQSLKRILERLINISKAELENKELTDDDYEFIRNFGDNLDSVVAGVNTESKETTIVADVHTDCNTEMVLEEGVGYVNLVLVAYNVPDGRLIVGAGPVFSYYEFKHPMDDRLTDEKWKEMLERNPPERPGWAGGIEG
ncbi:MAG: DUF3160 domain-containing protein [Methanophagales archaeon]|nr:DUF3160 domain-containing protein [Methanophagales archaeon]